MLDINYRKNRLTLYNSDTFERPNEEFLEIDLVTQNYKPYLPTKIITADGTRIDTKLLLDTGSALPFLLFLHTHPSLTLPENVIRGNLGRGLGGDLEGYLGKVRYLQFLQGIYFSNIITNFQQIDTQLDPDIYHQRNGLIGNPILSRFHIIIDLIKEKAFIKPRKNYNKSFEYDKSGLIIYAFGPTLDRYYIKDVIEKSPASEAGIKKGDIIKKVGIIPADFLSLATITRKLQKKEGNKVRFTLLRNGEKLRKTVVLRDLINDN
ncbi:MAG: PDZ domain-containing protein [Saprospiraceae bacterium]|nr:PDZ domain-containing protein [Saprospiraceae bacterium]